MHTMMKTLRSAVLAFCLAVLGSTAVMAHEGHDHEAIPKAQAVERATKEVDRLITSGKLEKSWKAAVLQTAEIKLFGEHEEWAVTFLNAQASDAGKKTLYVFLSPGGKYLASNFTGQ